MRFKTHSHRTHNLTTEDGQEVEIAYKPYSENDILGEVVGDKLVVAYLVHDDDDCGDIEDMIGEGVGKLYSFHRHAGQEDHTAGLEALGRDGNGDRDLQTVFDNAGEEARALYVAEALERIPLEGIVYYLGSHYDQLEGEGALEFATRVLIADYDEQSYPGSVFFGGILDDVLNKLFDDPLYFPGNPDAVSLDCYDHSGQTWSVSGGGMQCRWDTANGAGVWVPDDCLKSQLDSDEASGLNRYEQAVKYCRQFLESFNSMINGDVYGCVTEVFQKTGENADDWEQLEEDACWRYVGHAYAKETLQGEYFDSVVERLKKANHDNAIAFDKVEDTEGGSCD